MVESMKAFIILFERFYEVSIASPVSASLVFFSSQNCIIFLTISLKAITAGVPSSSWIKFFPSSQHRAILGSNGRVPRNGTFCVSAIFGAPPLVGGKIVEDLWHLGQMKSPIFSTTPITGMDVLRQKLISFLTSRRATSCGVVMMTAPSMPDDFRNWWTKY